MTVLAEGGFLSFVRAATRLTIGSIRARWPRVTCAFWRASMYLKRRSISFRALLLSDPSSMRTPAWRELVVDTPLARLDSEHRKNILNFWTSQKKRQVILLAQDEEIDADMFKSISGSVGKSYLLEHNDLGRGVGRARAVENQYFKER